LWGAGLRREELFDFFFDLFDVAFGLSEVGFGLGEAFLVAVLVVGGDLLDLEAGGVEAIIGLVEFLQEGVGDAVGLGRGGRGLGGEGLHGG
jgi:hypothetical protein